MVTKQQKSDHALAHKLREAVAAANDYANRLRERGYDILLEAYTGDGGNSEVHVNHIERTRTDAL